MALAWDMVLRGNKFSQVYFNKVTSSSRPELRAIRGHQEAVGGNDCQDDALGHGVGSSHIPSQVYTTSFVSFGRFLLIWASR